LTDQLKTLAHESKKEISELQYDLKRHQNLNKELAAENQKIRDGRHLSNKRRQKTLQSLNELERAFKS
jgi:hypothetical protein